jgi:hypothetical protein
MRLVPDHRKDAVPFGHNQHLHRNKGQMLCPSKVVMAMTEVVTMSDAASNNGG